MKAEFPRISMIATNKNIYRFNTIFVYLYPLELVVNMKTSYQIPLNNIVLWKLDFPKKKLSTEGLLREVS